VYALSEIFSKQTEEGIKQWKVSMAEIKEIFSAYDFEPLDSYKGEVQIGRLIPKTGTAGNYRDMGLKYYRANDFVNSLKSIQAIPASQRNYFDYKVMGACFARLNNAGKAIENWKTAYSMNPRDEELAALLKQYGR
jgi:hypothetical protein